MKKMERVGKESECPCCQGDFEWFDSGLEGDGAYFAYEWECKQCGKSGKEFHRLVFDSHVVDNADGEEELYQCAESTCCQNNDAHQFSSEQLKKKIIIDFREYERESLQENKQSIFENAYKHAVALQWYNLFTFDFEQWFSNEVESTGKASQICEALSAIPNIITELTNYLMGFDSVEFSKYELSRHFDSFVKGKYGIEM